MRRTGFLGRSHRLVSGAEKIRIGVGGETMKNGLQTKTGKPREWKVSAVDLFCGAGLVPDDMVMK
jgi:hypothetical protein